MIVIPSINVTDFKMVMKQLAEAKDFGATEVHMDISNGTLTKYETWDNPTEFQLALQASPLKNQVNIGVHLMVSDPDDVFESWIAAGVKKIIVHAETVRNLFLMKQQCDKAGVELVLAAGPQRDVDSLFKYTDFNNFMVLAVKPGPSGQKFKDEDLEKIKILREKMPDAKIEVDGGINYEIAQKLKSVGVNAITSGAYLWNSENHKEIFEKLKAI